MKVIAHAKPVSKFEKCLREKIISPVPNCASVKVKIIGAIDGIIYVEPITCPTSI